MKIENKQKMQKLQKVQKIGRNVRPYAYIFPILAILFVFVGVSLIIGIRYSFTKYNLIGVPEWGGLYNYKKMLGDTKLHQAVKTTVILIVFVVPAQIVLSTCFATLIAKRRNTILGKLAKAAIFIPVLSSSAVVGTVWKAILNGNNGLVQKFFHLFGIEPNMLLGSSTTALITVACIVVWKSMGYYMILMLSSVLSISDHYYEAAKMDGANGFYLFTKITLPMLKPAIILNFFLAVASGMQIFDLVYTMTGGGPSMSTTTLVMYLYDLTFKSGKAGYAMAISNVFFLVVVGIMLLQRGLMKKETSEL